MNGYKEAKKRKPKRSNGVSWPEGRISSHVYPTEGRLLKGDLILLYMSIAEPTCRLETDKSSLVGLAAKVLRETGICSPEEVEIMSKPEYKYEVCISLSDGRNGCYPEEDMVWRDEVMIVLRDWLYRMGYRQVIGKLIGISHMEYRMVKM